VSEEHDDLEDIIKVLETIDVERLTNKREQKGLKLGANLG